MTSLDKTIVIGVFVVLFSYGAIAFIIAGGVCHFFSF